MLETSALFLYSKRTHQYRRIRVAHCLSDVLSRVIEMSKYVLRSFVMDVDMKLFELYLAQWPRLVLYDGDDMGYFESFKELGVSRVSKVAEVESWNDERRPRCIRELSQ